jgi:mannose-6-phosphate isomerase-like protein (cupin superfamily)
MLFPNPGQPVNLTAAVELAGLLEGRGITQVLAGPDLTFVIHGPDGLEAVPEKSEADILYVIIAGYGVLCCSNGERIEFTAGDVMFVPAGAEHRFDEIGPKFRMWRIEIGQVSQAATEEVGAAPSPR